MLTIEEIKFNVVNESRNIIYRNIADVRIHDDPCIIIMFGGDDVARGIASKIGINLGDNDVASVIHDHEFWMKRIDNISIDNDTKEYISKNPKSGCIRIIAIGMGVFIVYDQNVKMIMAMFN